MLVFLFLGLKNPLEGLIILLYGLFSEEVGHAPNLHYGSILQYASVYTISHAVRSSGEATEDPLKSEFLTLPTHDDRRRL